MLEKIISQISKDYPEEEVCKLLDKEVLNWVEPDWNKEFDNEYDWYSDFGRGEAEEVIIDKMIGSWVSEHNQGVELPNELYLSVYESIRDKYYALSKG